MSTKRKIFLWIVAILIILAGIMFWLSRGDTADLSMGDVTGDDPVLEDPNAEMFPTVNIAEPVGWKDGEKPKAAEGLAVTRFAEGLDHPRVVHSLPNGDVLVTLTRAPKSEDEGGVTKWIADMLMSRAGAKGQSANKVMLLRDSNADGVADQKITLLDGLDSPSGIAYKEGTLLIANHNALLAFPFTAGQTKIEGKPKKLMDLPAGGNHWMRNIELSPDGNQVYVAVGSASNIGEHGMAAEEGRAAIWEYDLERNSSRIFASGLRNPNGLDWSPWTDELWTTVNERDMLGSDLVPDYLSNVPLGVQYGWPWYYYGNVLDDRVEEPVPASLPGYVRRPEYALGPHVAALGFRFTREGHRMGKAFGQGAFVARHGSWNRKPASGYDVVYVAFDDLGNPKGKPVPVLTGFLTGKGTTRGRPTWVEWAIDGSLLVTDDTAGIIWRVIAPKSSPGPAVTVREVEPLVPVDRLIDPEAAFTDEFARKVTMPTN